MFFAQNGGGEMPKIPTPFQKKRRLCGIWENRQKMTQRHHNPHHFGPWEGRGRAGAAEGRAAEGRAAESSSPPPPPYPSAPVFSGTGRGDRRNGGEWVLRLCGPPQPQGAGPGPALRHRVRAAWAGWMRDPGVAEGRQQGRGGRRQAERVLCRGRREWSERSRGSSGRGDGDYVSMLFDCARKEHRAVESWMGPSRGRRSGLARAGGRLLYAIIRPCAFTGTGWRMDLNQRSHEAYDSRRARRPSTRPSRGGAGARSLRTGASPDDVAAAQSASANTQRGIAAVDVDKPMTSVHVWHGPHGRTLQPHAYRLRHPRLHQSVPPGPPAPVRPPRPGTSS